MQTSIKFLLSSIFWKWIFSYGSQLPFLCAACRILGRNDPSFCIQPRNYLEYLSIPRRKPNCLALFFTWWRLATLSVSVSSRWMELRPLPVWQTKVLDDLFSLSAFTAGKNLDILSTFCDISRNMQHCLWVFTYCTLKLFLIFPTEGSFDIIDSWRSSNKHWYLFSESQSLLRKPVCRVIKVCVHF